MTLPADAVEVTCTREACHVVLAIPVDELDKVRGSSCPVCQAGVLELRETSAREGHGDPSSLAAWSARAVPAAVSELRSLVARFAESHGTPTGITNDMRLCVSEAITNAVIHAFRDRSEPGTVRVTAEVKRGDLIVHVRDDGLGFGPRLDSPGLGIGLPLIGSLASEMTVTIGEDGGTVICMTFRLGGALPGSGRVHDETAVS